MNLQNIIDHCTAKPGSSQDFPFDESTLVIRVAKKMFALINLNTPHRINLKCEPLTALELRRKHKAVTAGYHMNKKHWNTVNLDGTIPEDLIFKWIDDSYNLVLKSLTKTERQNVLLEQEAQKET